MLACGDCGMEVTLASADPLTGVGDCPGCGTLLDLQDAVVAAGPAPLATGPAQATDGLRTRPPASPPPEVEVLERSDGFSLAVSRGAAAGKFTFVMCCAGTLMLLGTAAFSASSRPGSVFVALLFTVATWWVARRTVGTSRLEVGREALEVCDLPWPLHRVSRRLPRRRFEQLFVAQHITYGKAYSLVTYDVCGLTPEGKRVVVVRGLGSAPAARWVEARLEAHYRIADRYVAGQHVEVEP